MEKHTNENGGCIGTIALFAIIAIIVYFINC